MFFEGDVLIFATALAIAALSPGPANMTLIAIVIANGARQGILFSVGIMLGDLVWLTLSLSGLAMIAEKIPLVFIAIKWLGISYLVYLAITVWRSTYQTSESITTPVVKSAFSQLLSGFILTMGNPKMMLFYIALLPSLLNPNNITFSGYLSLSMAVVAVLIIVFSIFVLASTKVRHMVRDTKAVRKLNHLTAITLGSATAWIAIK